MASIEQSLSVFSQALNLRTQRHQVSGIQHCQRGYAELQGP
jgi:hypothetical protein